MLKEMNCFFKATSTKDKAEKKTTDKPSNSLTKQSLELTVQKALMTKAESNFYYTLWQLVSLVIQMILLLNFFSQCFQTVLLLSLSH